MPSDAATAMNSAQTEMMPEGVGQVYDQSPESWGSDGQYLGGDAGGMPPPTGDAMGGDPMGGNPMGGDPMGGGDPIGGNPAFDGAMAAMDTAASANMAEGMDAANTAADVDEGKVDAEPGGGDVV
ncbi:hypothetical protein N8500_09505, partial [Candidatus Puniceispirillum sp.]|nr:hypothetical protein [Candidatus Puniceispirillum sp.]